MTDWPVQVNQSGQGSFNIDLEKIEGFKKETKEARKWETTKCKRHHKNYSSNYYEHSCNTFKLSCIITYRRPGVSFSINGFVASGVKSREVKPVPPGLEKQK